MTTSFLNLTTLHYKYSISIDNSRKSMSNNYNSRFV